MFEDEFLSGTEESFRKYQRLINQAAGILTTSLPSQPYVGKSPAELSRLISSDILPDLPRSSEDLAEQLRGAVANSISVAHPHTIAHLHCPPLLASLAAEVIISTLNQSMDSFDQAPFATVMEQEVVEWLREELGLPGTGDGTFTTGGSQSNYTGLLLARDACLLRRWKWSAQKSGLPAESRKLRILCSEAAHFTVEKSAAQLGLGTESVLRVPVDENFRMQADALKQQLAEMSRQGLVPMAIVATAGTTDFGSIDPLREVAALAREAGAWFHVDAAYGGALLFSKSAKAKLAGIELADSVTMDFHKLFWQPIPCSVFLVRDAAHFELIEMHADYLNPESHEHGGVPDLVTKSLLTSRRFDALKVFISLQSLGRRKLSAMIDRTMELAAHAGKVIEGKAELQLMCEPQLSTVVFRYLPSRAELDTDRLNSEIAQTLFKRGLAVIGQTRVRNRQTLKFTCMNPATTETQIASLIELIVEQGGLLEAGSRSD